MQWNKKTSISIIEPTWDQRVHLPFIIGLIGVIRHAYPDARLNFVGGSQQIEFLRDAIAKEALGDISFTPWITAQDRDTLPMNVLESAWRIKQLPVSITSGANLLVFSSCTSNTLSAITYLGLAGRSCAFLHGNANELTGWRSRNLVRRFFDFSSGLKRFCARGGKAIVLEHHIQERLGISNPWLVPHLVHIPHPLLPAETTTSSEVKKLIAPVQIGFAGLATIAKGFPDYLEFAKQLTEQRPNTFQFHAFGSLPKESRQFDQSALAAPTVGLERNAYINSLRKMHYIFSWHHEMYYNNAASGTIYDAVNLGIPLIARNSAQLSEWISMGFNIGHIFNSMESAIDGIRTFNIDFEQENYRGQRSDLNKLRESFSHHALASVFSKSFPITRGE